MTQRDDRARLLADASRELKARVAAANARKLGTAVGDKEGLDPDQLERRKRSHDDKVQGSWQRVRRAAMWVGFVCAAGLFVALAVFVLVLIVAYGYTTIKGGGIGGVLANIGTFMGGVFTTMTVEYLWHLRAKNGS